MIFQLMEDEEMNDLMRIYTYDNIEYVAATKGELVESAKKLRHDVYLDVGYIKNIYASSTIEDNHFSDVYLIGHDDNLVLGTLRFSSIELVSELKREWRNDLRENAEKFLMDAESSNSVVVGALAVKKGSNSRKVSWGIYKASLLYSWSLNIDSWIVAIDARALRVMDIVGWRIERIGRPIKYMGSLTVLCYINISLQLKSFEKKNNAFYEFLCC